MLVCFEARFQHRLHLPDHTHDYASNANVCLQAMLLEAVCKHKSSKIGIDHRFKLLDSDSLALLIL